MDKGKAIEIYEWISFFEVNSKALNTLAEPEINTGRTRLLAISPKGQWERGTTGYLVFIPRDKLEG